MLFGFLERVQLSPRICLSFLQNPLVLAQSSWPELDAEDRDRSPTLQSRRDREICSFPYPQQPGYPAFMFCSHPKPSQNQPRPSVPATHVGRLGVLVQEGGWASSLEPRIGDCR